jgi:hypothetical protein
MARISQRVRPDTVYDNAGRFRLILGIAIFSLLIYACLALAGDLRERLPLMLGAQAALVGLMLAAWYAWRAGASRSGLLLGFALAFRIVAALGAPALSDDVYRYVWDGRVQLQGNSPYRYAPDDPALTELRDENWARINHPELRTVYPPLAQLLFLALAAIGVGPLGFKLTMGLIDFGVVLALDRLLRARGLPPDRLVLYAWNPLAVLETAGSGHVEPLGALLVVLAAVWLRDRPRLAPLALGAAVHVKLLPIVLLPGYLRRFRTREALLLALALVLLLIPFAIQGQSLGTGLGDYATRWERNSVVFSALQLLLERIDAGETLKRGVAALQRRLGDEGWIPWDFLYHHVWPPYLARLIVGLAALGWIGWLSFRREPDPGRESLLVLGGVLLLLPTLHPWYLLWVLPFAAAYLCWPWLLLAALVPLGYWGGGADVPWSIRAVEYLPPLVLAVWMALGRRR